MGARQLVEESLSALMGFGRATASTVLSAASSVVLTIRGDEDPAGDEEIEDVELWGHAPLLYRPKDPDSAGELETLFVRLDDDRVVIGTKDRRFQVAPAVGEVILVALGKDGTEQARVSLAAGGTVTITGDSVLAGGSVALAEHPDLDAHLAAIAADLDAINTAIPTGVSVLPAARGYGAAKKVTIDGTNPIATEVTKGT